MAKGNHASTKSNVNTLENERNPQGRILGKEWVDITKMPLSFVPLPQDREGRFTQGEKETAEHELNHALAAKSRNIYPDMISVVREGNTLGKNTFSGHINPETWKVIAAGGAISLSDGTPASGYGMDMYSAKLMQYFYGGMSFEQAKHKAKSALMVYEKKVRGKAAEIIACMKVVNGNQLDDVLRRAEFELAMEKGEQLIAYMYVPNKAEESKADKQKDNNQEKQTIVEYLTNNQCRLTYTTNGKVVETRTFCGVCKGIDGHNKGCSVADQNSAKTENETKLKNTDRKQREDSGDNIHDLKTEGLILSSYSVKINPGNN